MTGGKTTSVVSKILKTINDHFLNKYPYLFLETKEIFLFPSDYRKEYKLSTEINYIGKQYLNKRGNPIYNLSMSQNHSASLYIILNNEFKKISSITDFVDNIDNVLQKVEDFLYELFIPHEKYHSPENNYFRKITFLPSIYVDDYYDYLPYGAAYEEDNELLSYDFFQNKVISFLKNTIQKYQVKQPKSLNFQFSFSLKSYPLLLKENDGKAYFVYVSFLVDYLMREIL